MAAAYTRHEPIDATTALLIKAERFANPEQSFQTIAEKYNNVITHFAARRIFLGEIHAYLPVIKTKEQAEDILKTRGRNVVISLPTKKKNAAPVQVEEPFLIVNGKTTKFKRSMVLAIRAAEGSQADIAKRFGINGSSVSRIKTRKMFANID